MIGDEMIKKQITEGQIVRLYDNIFDMIVKRIVFEHGSVKADCALAGDDSGKTWRFTLDILTPAEAA